LFTARVSKEVRGRYSVQSIFRDFLPHKVDSGADQMFLPRGSVMSPSYRIIPQIHLSPAAFARRRIPFRSFSFTLFSQLAVSRYISLCDNGSRVTVSIRPADDSVTIGNTMRLADPAAAVPVPAGFHRSRHDPDCGAIRQDPSGRPAG